MIQPKRNDPLLARPHLVDDQAQLLHLLEQLRQMPLLALDTESDSLYSYASKVCLIQLAAPTEWQEPDPTQVVDYLVDPLSVDVQPLGELLAAPGVEVVMHAAENDIMTLQRDLGFTCGAIFDTQLAARILGWKGVGLAAILERLYGVTSDKRMQRTNWGQRPLSSDQIAYAQIDAHYLLQLRALLIQELQAADRWEEAQEAFWALLQLDYSDKGQNRRTVWSMKEVRKVPLSRMGLLEELWLWREETAERLDRPPFKIMGDRSLLAMAATPPTRIEELARIAGLSGRQVEQYGRQLLAAVQRGRRRPRPSLPDGTGNGVERLDPAVQARYDALRSWRSATAEKRGVDPDIVFSNEILLAIALQVPRRPEELQQVPAIGPWKAGYYGGEVIDLLARSG